MTFLFKIALATSFSLYFSTLHASHLSKESSSEFSSAPQNFRLIYPREEILNLRNVDPDPKIIARIPKEIRSKTSQIQSKKNGNQAFPSQDARPSGREKSLKFRYVQEGSKVIARIPKKVRSKASQIQSKKNGNQAFPSQDARSSGGEELLELRRYVQEDSEVIASILNKIPSIVKDTQSKIPQIQSDENWSQPFPDQGDRPSGVGSSQLPFPVELHFTFFTPEDKPQRT